MMTPAMPLPLVTNGGEAARQPRRPAGLRLDAQFAHQFGVVGRRASRTPEAVSTREGEGRRVGQFAHVCPSRCAAVGSRMTLAMSDSRLATSTAVVSSSSCPWMKE